MYFRTQKICNRLSALRRATAPACSSLLSSPILDCSGTHSVERMSIQMRRFQYWCQLASLLICCVFIDRRLLAAEGLPADAHVLSIGETAPDFSLRGIDGKSYSLADFKEAPVLMVVFLSN